MMGPDHLHVTRFCLLISVSATRTAGPWSTQLRLFPYAAMSGLVDGQRKSALFESNAELASLAELYHRVPALKQHRAHLESTLQGRIHSLCVAQRALASLESGRLELERQCETVSALSEALAPATAISDVYRRSSTSKARESGAESHEKGRLSPQPSDATIPSPLADVGGAREAGTGKGVGASVLSEKARGKLRAECATFSSAHSAILERFEQAWLGAMGRARGWADAGSCTGSDHRRNGGMATFGRSTSQQTRSAVDGRSGKSFSDIADAGKPESSWLSSALGDGRFGHSDLPHRSAELVLRILQALLNDPDGAARRITALDSEALGTLCRPLAEPGGVGASEPHSNHSGATPIDTTLGLMTASIGPHGVLAFAEAIFVHAVARIEDKAVPSASKHDLENFLLSFLGALAMLDLSVEEESGEEVDTPGMESRSNLTAALHHSNSANIRSNLGPLFPSQALETELLAYLKDSRRWAMLHPVPVSSSSLSGKTRRVPTAGSFVAAHRSASGTGSTGSVVGSPFSASLATFGENAADLWNASMASGVSTITGFFGNAGLGLSSSGEESNSTFLSNPFSRASRALSHGSVQSTERASLSPSMSPPDSPSPAQRNAAVAHGTASAAGKAAHIPASLSLSRFVTQASPSKSSISSPSVNSANEDALETTSVKALMPGLKEYSPRSKNIALPGSPPDSPRIDADPSIPEPDAQLLFATGSAASIGGMDAQTRLGAIAAEDKVDRGVSVSSVQRNLEGGRKESGTSARKANIRLVSPVPTAPVATEHRSQLGIGQPSSSGLHRRPSRDVTSTRPPDHALRAAARILSLPSSSSEPQHRSSPSGRETSPGTSTPKATTGPSSLFTPTIVRPGTERPASDATGRSAHRSSHTLPLVLALSRRLLRVHFPAETHLKQHRRLSLLLVVRWWAFVHLRALITRPEASGRRLAGGSTSRFSLALVLPSYETSALPRPIAEGHFATSSPSPARRTYRGRRVAGDGPQPMEDVWLADASSAKHLGELHRTIYLALVDAAGFGTSSVPEGSDKEIESASTELAMAAQSVLELFGVRPASPPSPLSPTSPPEFTTRRWTSPPAADPGRCVTALSLSRSEVASLVQLFAPLLVDRSKNDAQNMPSDASEDEHIGEDSVVIASPEDEAGDTAKPQCCESSGSSTLWQEFHEPGKPAQRQHRVVSQEDVDKLLRDIAETDAFDRDTAPGRFALLFAFRRPRDGRLKLAQTLKGADQQSARAVSVPRREPRKSDASHGLQGTAAPGRESKASRGNDQHRKGFRTAPRSERGASVSTLYTGHDQMSSSLSTISSGGVSSLSSGWHSPARSPFHEPLVEEDVGQGFFDVQVGPRFASQHHRRSQSTTTGSYGTRASVFTASPVESLSATAHDPLKQGMSAGVQSKISSYDRLRKSDLGSSPPANTFDFSKLPMNELRKGIFGLLRSGHGSAYIDAYSPPLLSLLRQAAQSARASYNFAEALLFERTVELLHFISLHHPEVAHSAFIAQQSGSEAFSEHDAMDADFGPLLSHISAPLRAADAERASQMLLVQARLADVEAHCRGLNEHARMLLARINELRIRTWYASEIRTASTVIEARRRACTNLEAGLKQPDGWRSDPITLDKVQDDPSKASESADGWMRRLGIYDFDVGQTLKRYFHDLDPAFGSIAGDARVFFESPL